MGAINWGFVSGKSNTIFPWGSKEEARNLQFGFMIFSEKTELLLMKRR